MPLDAWIFIGCCLVTLAALGTIAFFVECFIYLWRAVRRVDDDDE